MTMSDDHPEIAENTFVPAPHKIRHTCAGAPPQIITDRAQQTKRQKKIKITLPLIKIIE